MLKTEDTNPIDVHFEIIWESVPDRWCLIENGILAPLRGEGGQREVTAPSPCAL